MMSSMKKAKLRNGSQGCGENVISYRQVKNRLRKDVTFE